MLKTAKLMLAAPSANPHKALSPTSAGQVMDSMSGKLAAVLDGGECQLGIESTILDLTSATPCVLRAGPITADELSIFLQREVIHLRTHSHKVSGNLREHYRPKTPLFLKTAEQMQEHRDYPVARLLLGFAPEEIDVSITLNRRMPSEKQAYARLLYKALYELDQSGAQEIWVQLPPTTHEWLDVYDRLKRAATNIPE
jgi:L-threonylcarbamoyladenylate synthase